MDNKQQTAVESVYFIMESFISKKDRIHLKGVLEKAKEMEKQRIETAYNKGTVHGIDYPESTLPITGEQYYNETYGGCEQ
jgi:hypothetical protein